MWQQIIVVLPLAIWSTLCEMAPYLLFGFLVAGLLSVFISPEIVERHLGGRGLWPVVKASFLGVPLPLCSCGVIPVAASLRRHGANASGVILLAMLAWAHLSKFKIPGSAARLSSLKSGALCSGEKNAE